MHIIIQSSIHTLNKSKILLQLLNDAQLSDCSIPPYNSCIGSHLRHILDFYDCILVEGDHADLTARKRHTNIENNCDVALQYLEGLVGKIKNIDEQTINRIVLVTDDLGLGKVEIEYTFSSLLAQANSHAIHHYAIINYILDGLKINITDDNFGYNPTTPRQVVN
ncbi:MAG: hypothetical protein ACI83H_002650 [Glaciecola sp.]|jgi:hypothetical protein